MKEGLRDRKKRETRERIESAAIDLFDRNGFDATTIDDIAVAADVAPRTFFLHFAAKEDVVLADYADRLDRIIVTLAERPDDEAPWVALRAAFMAIAADYETAEPDLIRRFQIMATTPSVFARSLQLQAGWENSVADALRARHASGGHGGLTTLLLSAAALAAMRASLRNWLESGAGTPLPVLVAECFDQLARGLDAP